jgi:hypothetical protein
MPGRTYSPSEDVPERVARAFSLISEPRSPEELLWREVCLRAALDAIGQTGMSEIAAHFRIIREARMWFKFDSMAQTVYDLGGVDFQAVKEAVLAVKPPY